MSYPLAIKAAAHKLLDGEAAKRAAAHTPQELAAVDKAVAKAQADLAKWGDETTSFMGLTKPLIELKNPGIISIPLGFLAVILGSLWRRDRRAEATWNEVYARQNTGLLVSKGTAGHG